MINYEHKEHPPCPDQGARAVEAAIGYAFRDRSLLGAVLRRDGERFEFLGDSIVKAVVTDLVFSAFPEEETGPLTIRRVALTRNSTMAAVADGCGLSPFLFPPPRCEKDRADGLEALIGAVYADGGLAAARAVAAALWTPLLRAQGAPPQDPRSALLEWTQEEGLPPPLYITRKRPGAPDGERVGATVLVATLPALFACACASRPAKTAAAQIMLRLVEAGRLQPA